MQISEIKIPAAGEWPRDCELKSISLNKGLLLNYHRESDDSNWNLKFEIIPAYKVIGEEFSRSGYLSELPINGSFFEILDSPWIKELRVNDHHSTKNCKHYVFQFYDETIEVLAGRFSFEQTK